METPNKKTNTPKMIFSVLNSTGIYFSLTKYENSINYSIPIVFALYINTKGGTIELNTRIL
jgi:hypothetical protein